MINNGFLEKRMEEKIQVLGGKYNIFVIWDAFDRLEFSIIDSESGHKEFIAYDTLEEEGFEDMYDQNKLEDKLEEINLSVSDIVKLSDLAIKLSGINVALEAVVDKQFTLKPLYDIMQIMQYEKAE